MGELRVVQFSGGKDSTALVLWAIEQAWSGGFTAVFCDTGWEHPLTYEYVERVNHRLLNGSLVTVRNTKYRGLVELSQKRKIVPTVRMRFCTEELKVKPFAEWMRAQDFDSATVYQGIRAGESHARSQMPRRAWEPLYDAWIERPLFDWSSDQVFDLHRKHGVGPNPLYTMGAGRVGCFPCVMVNKAELRRMTPFLPEVWDRAQAVEDAVVDGRSFFRTDFIPARFHSGRYHYDTPDGGSKSGSYPTVDDVRRYVTGADDTQARLWVDEPRTCLSVYNLCE